MSPTDTTAEDGGPASSGLDRARDYVAACVDRGQIAGAVSLLAKNGKTAQVACVGLRDIEAAKPMEPDTIFRIASMTKPIVRRSSHRGRCRSAAGRLPGGELDGARLLKHETVRLMTRNHLSAASVR